MEFQYTLSGVVLGATLSFIVCTWFNIRETKYYIDKWMEYEDKYHEAVERLNAAKKAIEGRSDD